MVSVPIPSCIIITRSILDTPARLRQNGGMESQSDTDTPVLDAGGSVTEDARELAHDEGLVPTSANGLTYPLGDKVPGMGEMIEVRPGILWGRLPIFGQLKHVNVLAVEDDGGDFAVVDTGFRTSQCSDGWKAMLAGPLAGRRASKIICTHMHADHIGLAGWLCHKFQAPLWMTRGEWLMARMLIADARDTVPEEQIAFWRGTGWSEGQIERAAEHGFGRMARAVSQMPLGYRRMVEGELIPMAGRRWEVFVGSGHSPEHACLLDREGKVLIAGDQVLPRISSNISMGVTEPEADPLGEWLVSLAKLKTLPDDLLVLPGHGEPFYGLHTRCTALEEEHHGRLDALVENLGEPLRAVDCFGWLFRRPIGDDVIGMASGEALAHLRHLEVTGRITRETRDGVWWWRRV